MENLLILCIHYVLLFIVVHAASQFTEEEHKKYSLRFQEGYDLHDKRYEQWLKEYHPAEFSLNLTPLALSPTHDHIEDSLLPLEETPRRKISVHGSTALSLVETRPRWVITAHNGSPAIGHSSSSVQEQPKGIIASHDHTVTYSAAVGERPKKTVAVYDRTAPGSSSVRERPKMSVSAHDRTAPGTAAVRERPKKSVAAQDCTSPSTAAVEERPKRTVGARGHTATGSSAVGGRPRRVIGAYDSTASSTSPVMEQLKRRVALGHKATGHTLSAVEKQPTKTVAVLKSTAPGTSLPVKKQPDNTTNHITSLVPKTRIATRSHAAIGLGVSSTVDVRMKTRIASDHRVTGHIVEKRPKTGVVTRSSRVATDCASSIAETRAKTRVTGSVRNAANLPGPKTKGVTAYSPMEGMPNNVVIIRCISTLLIALLVLCVCVCVCVCLSIMFLNRAHLSFKGVPLVSLEATWEHHHTYVMCIRYF